MSRLDKMKARRIRRKMRVRRKIEGNNERPRLTVFKSNKNIFAQLIDDLSKKTLASASTLDKDLNSKSICNITSAKKVGELLAKRAKEKQITEVIFDRNGYLYHGKIKALAEGCRENGLKF